MKIIKRDGSEVEFRKDKIVKAIKAANRSVAPNDELPMIEAEKIAQDIQASCDASSTPLSVEEIQDMVIYRLMQAGAFRLAHNYAVYRYKHELIRKDNSTDNRILSIVNGTNADAKTENSNKNPDIISVQRDYIAGETSRDITERILLPDDVVAAHKEGIIHFHDTDYFLTKEHNCSLVNIDDMLQNGTVISGTLIERPHRFSTACNISTQIIAQVASSQFGGQSISLTHLAKFVDVSRQALRKEVAEENRIDGNSVLTEKKINAIAERRLRKEIKAGIQTIQYQVLTLMTTNGQAPFLTVFMYLNECGDDERLKADLAICIEEMLLQRIEGVKNERGVWISPAFPKLIYVLEEDNIHKDSKYWYLTELAAKCSAKRMVPDYISEKVMKQNKVDDNGNGQCYPCMGCVEGNEIITYRFNKHVYVEAFKRMWDRLSKEFEVKHQFSFDNPNLYMDLTGVEIYDTLNGFVETKRIIRNHNSQNWVKVKMSNGRLLTCTDDHPFATSQGRVLAKDLNVGDVVWINLEQFAEEDTRVSIHSDLAWAYGLLLCDGSIASTPNACFAISGEDDIIQRLKETIEKYYNIIVSVKEQHRGEKGNYKEVCMPSRKLQYDLIMLFEGIAKEDRHIPNLVFSSSKESRLAFLAGMIDADGYINDAEKLTKVQIGSTNKELALQQMALMQSLGMPAFIYENHYSSSSRKIRYRVECVPDAELIKALVCKKKSSKFENNVRSNSSRNEYSVAQVISVDRIEMVDFSYDVTTNSDHFEVSGIYSHNCRSFLTPYLDENDQPKYYGRFNQGVVTINLVDVAMSSKKDMETFWNLFENRLELCHKALRLRHERLKGTLSDVAPILWQHGALARLKKGETIDKLLFGNYSTLSLGYAGLYECVKYMTGHSHTDESAKPFALQVMQKMNDKCAEWRAAENIAYSLYGTPLESTTYKFAKCLRNRFGDEWDKLAGGKNYITNSYHCHVTEHINAFEKLKFESEFQTLSPGGAVSYVEVPNMQKNISAVLAIMQYIYDNIMYAELNTKSDYCQCCGYDGEIQIVEDNGELVWECPNCGNRDQDKMNVARRTCGKDIATI